MNLHNKSNPIRRIANVWNKYWLRSDPGVFEKSPKVINYDNNRKGTLQSYHLVIISGRYGRSRSVPDWTLVLHPTMDGQSLDCWGQWLVCKSKHSKLYQSNWRVTIQNEVIMFVFCILYNETRLSLYSRQESTISFWTNATVAIEALSVYIGTSLCTNYIQQTKCVFAHNYQRWPYSNTT